MNNFCMLFGGTIMTEAITQLLVKSDFFYFLRHFFDKRAKRNRVYEFFSDLLFCGYCTSVWVAFGTAAVLVMTTDLYFVHGYFDWLIAGVLMHRASNALHFIIDILDNARGTAKDKG